MATHQLIATTHCRGVISQWVEPRPRLGMCREKYLNTWLRVSHYYSRIPMLIYQRCITCYVMSYLWLLIDIFSTKSFDIIHIMWNSLVMTIFHSCLYIHMLIIFFCSILNCAPWHLFCSCSNGLLTCSYVHFDDFTYLLVRYSLRSFFCFCLFVLVTW